MNETDEVRKTIEDIFPEDEVLGFPSEAELAEGRKYSTMTREDALEALDSMSRLCHRLTSDNAALRQVLREWQKAENVR